MGSDQRASSRGREQITIAIETDTNPSRSEGPDGGKLWEGQRRIQQSHHSRVGHLQTLHWGQEPVGWDQTQNITLEINIQTLGLHSSTIWVAAAPLPSQC